MSLPIPFFTAKGHKTHPCIHYTNLIPPLSSSKKEGGKEKEKKTSRDSAKVILHNNAPLIGVLDGSRIRHSFWQLR